MHRMLVAFSMAIVMTPGIGFAQSRAPTLRLAPEILREVAAGESAGVAALPPALRQQQPQERSWPGRHPVLFGALVGLGAGLAIEAAVIPGASGGEPHSAYIPMFACTGAGIGSLVGLIVSAARR